MNNEIEARGMGKANTPIIVFGCARSGTTSLMNLLGDHSDIAVAMHPLHHGNVEWPLYYHSRFWGDLSKSNNYLKLVLSLEIDDFFLTCNGTTAEFLKQPRADIYELFFDLMDHFVESSGAKRWALKFDLLFFTNPVSQKEFFDRLAARYGGFEVIGIFRKWGPYLNSYLRMEGQYHNERNSQFGRLLATVIGLARHKYYNKKIREVLKRYNGLELDFDDFIKSDDKAIGLLADIVGVPRGSLNTSSEWQPNTSFTGHQNKRTNSPSLMQHLVAGMMRLPFCASALVKTTERFRKFKNLQDTRIREAELFPDRLRQRLKEEGATALVKKLDEILECSELDKSR